MVNFRTLSNPKLDEYQHKYEFHECELQINGSMSVKEILQRYACGQPLPRTFDNSYDDDGSDDTNFDPDTPVMDAFGDFDLADLDDLREYNDQMKQAVEVSQALAERRTAAPKSAEPPQDPPSAGPEGIADD